MQEFSKIMHVYYPSELRIIHQNFVLSIRTSYYPSELNRIEVKTDAIMAAVYLTREA